METHRDNIRVMMEAWSAAHGEPIDVGVYLTKTQIDDILNMRFDPGNASATYRSAEKNMSILACRPWTADDIEELREIEQAAAATEGTHTLKEQGCLTSNILRLPEASFLKLRLTIATLAALLWM